MFSPGQTIVIDGLALGVLPELAETLNACHRLIGLVHHPLAFERGLSSDEAEALRVSERAALAATRLVVATSPFTARLLEAEYGVAPGRIAMVKPGVDRRARARPGPPPVSILAVGAVTPRKGYDVLLAACALIADLPWRLTIVGDLTRDARAVAQLRAAIAKANLGARVRLAGEMAQDELERLYGEAAIFALASHFEGYGMAFAEAIAHGVPVIGTMGGAIGETLPEGAALLAPPGDAIGFGAALRRAIEDTALRRRLGAAAWRAAETFPTWEQAAAAFEQAIERAG